MMGKPHASHERIAISVAGIYTFELNITTQDTERFLSIKLKGFNLYKSIFSSYFDLPLSARSFPCRPEQILLFPCLAQELDKDCTCLSELESYLNGLDKS